MNMDKNNRDFLSKWSCQQKVLVVESVSDQTTNMEEISDVNSMLWTRNYHNRELRYSFELNHLSIYDGCDIVIFLLCE